MHRRDKKYNLNLIEKLEGEIQLGDPGANRR
jgi:hypothetical protein